MQAALVIIVASMPSSGTVGTNAVSDLFCTTDEWCLQYPNPVLAESGARSGETIVVASRAGMLGLWQRDGWKDAVDLGGHCFNYGNCRENRILSVVEKGAMRAAQAAVDGRCFEIPLGDGRFGTPKEVSCASVTQDGDNGVTEWRCTGRDRPRPGR